MNRFVISSFFVFITTVILSACGSSVVQPQINFIGVGSGTLASDINTIQYSQIFEPQSRSLIAVVSFADVSDGSTVQATWFSPDDRSMPLGRTSIVTRSGSKIARFSFVSKEDWQPSPYQLRIDVQSGEDPKNMRTTSGSLAFFIGMKEQAIKAYLEDLADWKREEAKKQAVYTEQQKKEQAITDAAAKQLGAAGAMIALRTDFVGHGEQQFFIVGQKKEDMDGPPLGGGGPGVLYSGTPQGFTITDASGSTLLTAGEIVKGKRIVRDATATLFGSFPKTGDLQVVVLPSHTIAISWQNGRASCTVELRVVNGKFVYEGDEPCQN